MTKICALTKKLIRYFSNWSEQFDMKLSKNNFGLKFYLRQSKHNIEKFDGGKNVWLNVWLNLEIYYSMILLLHSPTL